LTRPRIVEAGAIAARAPRLLRRSTRHRTRRPPLRSPPLKQLWKLTTGRAAKQPRSDAGRRRLVSSDALNTSWPTVTAARRVAKQRSPGRDSRVPSPFQCACVAGLESPVRVCRFGGVPPQSPSARLRWPDCSFVTPRMRASWVRRSAVALRTPGPGDRQHDPDCGMSIIRSLLVRCGQRGCVRPRFRARHRL
jgi:hypothetical protein